MSYHDIYNLIEYSADNRHIPNIKSQDWLELIHKYNKEDIRLALTNYIIENKVDFPNRVISKEEFETLFLEFCKTSMLSEYKIFTQVLEKFDYKYKYSDKPLGVIDKSHVYNSVSNYFQQLNRMKCGSNLVDSPYDIWNNSEKLNKMNWHFWRLGAFKNKDLNESAFREAFRIGTYTATQFKPSVAKALYEKHNARIVLDTSCGWGDRLAAFYATKSTQVYVGCDPNPEVYETYKQQCIAYETLLGKKPCLDEYEDYFVCRGIKTVTIYNKPSEDIDWARYTYNFDFYFTSPPYFETERYGSKDVTSQSYYRYPTFESWKNDFFFKVNKMIYNTLKKDAYMMINIIEPRIKNGTRLNLCDDMVDDILTYPDMHYLGKIGMRLQARPHNIVNVDKNSVFIEPIYVFRKNNNNYDIVEQNTFSSLFEMP
jgi:hypothetical protein